MKMTSEYILLLAFACHPGVSAGQVALDSCASPTIYYTTYAVSVNPSLPTYLIRFEESERCYKLSISRDGQPSPLQVIQHSTSSDGPLPTPDCDYCNKPIEFVDVNFDGFKDIMVVENESARFVSYSFYLFDINSGSFKLNDEFSDLVGFNTRVDTSEQAIETGGGESDANWYLDTYEVDDGKLVLAEREEVSQDSVKGVPQFDLSGDPICVHTLKRLTSGKLILVKKVVAPIGDLDDEWLKH